MNNYVNLTYENSLKLYHYCVSIADAIRPFLNGVSITEADPEYWQPKLIEFKQVLSDILHSPELPKEVE